MTAPIHEPDATGTEPRQPGDRPPAVRLVRPPSDRYARTATGAASGDDGEELAGGASGRRAFAPALGRALAAALVAVLVTAAALVLIGGVLAARQGLLAIAGLGGAAVGLLTSRAAVSPDGVAPPALSRAAATRAAIALAVLAVVSGALGTWAYGRLEGGVMDPLSYLWETFGLFVPVEVVVASIAAAWGARAGPIQGRS